MSKERNASALSAGGILWPVNSLAPRHGWRAPADNAMYTDWAWSKETGWRDGEKDKNVVWSIPHE